MKRKILVSVLILKDIGGISASASNLLWNICDKYDVTLCVTSSVISANFKIPQNVRLISGSQALGDAVAEKSCLSNQGLFRKLIRNIRRLLRELFSDRYIRSCISKINIEDEYDAALAFGDFSYSVTGFKYDYFNVLSNVKAKIKIAWVHHEPRQLEFSSNALCGFDYVVNISRYCKQKFDSIMPALASQSAVVYNTYNIEELKNKSTQEKNCYENNGKIHFVTVGRILNREKRMDRIVDTCIELTKQGYQNFDWTIVGDGVDRMQLENQVKSNNLTKVVRFVGLKPNPYPYMQQADCFVLTSLSEGFGMAIREAQILGTPTIVTRFGSAPETVNEGVDGYICDNSTEGVTDMVKTILDKPYLLTEIRDNLHNNPVTNDIALRQFDNLINAVRTN